MSKRLLSPERPLRAVATLLVASASIAACNGTAIYDAIDPDACAEGHGCPMAACSCTDGSVVLDTTCQRGVCAGVQDVCLERCEPYGGPKSAFGTPNDVVPIPACDTFCDRLRVNDCELGCPMLFSECVEPLSCDLAATQFWDCVVERGKLSCSDLALRIEGCGEEPTGLCSQ
jgi:hypothetical protein